MPVDAVHRRMLADARADGFDDLVPAHLAVLKYPGPQGRRPSDLAVAAGMTKQAMNYLLGQLEELGYVVRRDDPGDRRSRRVELTERGEELVVAIRRSVAAIEAELEEELGSKHFGQLKALLVELNERWPRADHGAAHD